MFAQVPPAHTGGGSGCAEVRGHEGPPRAVRGDSAAQLQVFFGGPRHELMGFLMTSKFGKPSGSRGGLTLCARPQRAFCALILVCTSVMDRLASYIRTCACGLLTHAHAHRGPLLANLTLQTPGQALDPRADHNPHPPVGANDDLMAKGPGTAHGLDAQAPTFRPGGAKKSICRLLRSREVRAASHMTCARSLTATAQSSSARRLSGAHAATTTTAVAGEVSELG